MAHVEETITAHEPPKTFRALEAGIVPLLLSFLFPANPLSLLLLFAFSQIHNEDDETLPTGDPLGMLRQKRARAKHARRELEHEEQKAAHASRAAATPEPWPQALPSNLPPFPAGWVRADPPTKSMVTRAYQLLQPLWLQGENSRSTERDPLLQVWVTYVAEKTSDGKHGIVAYLIDKHHSNKKPAPGTRAQNATHDGRPVLRQGSGMGALAGQKPYVVDVQTRLRVVPADGMFGSDTRLHVVRFQQQHGLPADGVVGPATWAQLDQLQDPRSMQAYNVQVGPAYDVRPLS